MRRQPALLRISAATAWITALVTGFDGSASRVNAHIFVLSSVVAAVLSLCALMQATVTARIDRMYAAMFRAAMPTEASEPHGRHQRLAVVPEPDRRQHGHAVLPR